MWQRRLGCGHARLLPRLRGLTLGLCRRQGLIIYNGTPENIPVLIVRMPMVKFYDHGEVTFMWANTDLKGDLLSAFACKRVCTNVCAPQQHGAATPECLF